MNDTTLIAETLEYVVERAASIKGFLMYGDHEDIEAPMESAFKSALEKGLLPNQEVIFQDLERIPVEERGKGVGQAILSRWAIKVLDHDGGGDLRDLIDIASKLSNLLRQEMLSNQPYPDREHWTEPLTLKEIADEFGYDVRDVKSLLKSRQIWSLKARSRYIIDSRILTIKADLS